MIHPSPSGKSRALFMSIFFSPTKRLTSSEFVPLCTITCLGHTGRSQDKMLPGCFFIFTSHIHTYTYTSHGQANFPCNRERERERERESETLCPKVSRRVECVSIVFFLALWPRAIASTSGTLEGPGCLSRSQLFHYLQLLLGPVR